LKWLNSPEESILAHIDGGEAFKEAFCGVWHCGDQQLGIEVWGCSITRSCKGNEAPVDMRYQHGYTGYGNNELNISTSQQQTLPSHKSNENGIQQ
jgi:hypothetical protein